MSKDRIAQAVGRYAANTSQPTGYDLPDDFLNALPDTNGQGIPEGAIVPRDDGSMQLGNSVLTRTGLQLPESTTVKEWELIGRRLLSMKGSIQWLLGDWLAFGEDHEWGETYLMIAGDFEYEVNTLYNLASVCRKIEFSRRREKLSFGHHQAVTSKAPDEQQAWLEYAEAHDLSVKDLRAAIKSQKPPTLSSPSMRVFQNRYAKTRETELEFASRVGESERLEIAAMYRKLASEIENLG